MKPLMLLLTVGILSGCATNEVAIPDWEIARIEAAEVTRPTPLPSLPEIFVEGDRAYVTRNGLLQLEAYKVVAEGNYDSANYNAEAMKSYEAAYNHLIEAAKAQQQLEQIRKELLEQERRERTMDRWFYRGVFVLAGVVVGIK